MSEIKEKLDRLIATDYERELLLKIDDVIEVTKLPLLKNVKIGQTKQACRVLLRYEREIKSYAFLSKNKMVLVAPCIRKHFDILQPLARELHAYISAERAKGTSFY